MTDVDDWSEPYHDREPDPSDYGEREAEEAYWEHRDQVHGGEECGCPPSRLPLLKDRAVRLFWSARAKVTALSRRPCTVRVGPAEITIRLNVRRRCCACGSEGWFYSKTGLDPKPMPEGYDGVSLCGCGSAIGKLAEARRYVRQAQKEAPF